MAVPPEEGTPRPRRTRNPNYRSTIYQTKDGYWHGRVTIGARDDGQPDRRHIGGKTRSEVAEKVRALERERDQGTVRKAGERWTVGRWLTYWVENIAAPPHVAENTHNGYLVDVNKHLNPGLGAHRLERLTPDHVERLYAKLQRDGLSPGGVHHVHRTLRAALNEAVRRSHLPRNPVLLARAPEARPTKRSSRTTSRRSSGCSKPPPSGATAPGGRWRSRSACARARRSGSPGTTWTWTRARSASDAPGCARSTSTGCGGTCGKTPGYCPQRVITRAATGGVKSRAGRRTIGLPPQLVALLRNHRAEQEQEQAEARELWHDEGWVFASPTGAADSTRTPTTTSGSGCSRRPGCAKGGCTTPGTPPRPCCWSCASRRRP